MTYQNVIARKDSKETSVSLWKIHAWFPDAILVNVSPKAASISSVFVILDILVLYVQQHWIASIVILELSAWIVRLVVLVQMVTPAMGKLVPRPNLVNLILVFWV